MLDFKIGSTVKVVRQSKYYNFNLTGKIGTVTSGYGANIRVNFDGIRNPNSSYGAFYFKPSELEIVIEKTEEKTMQNITNYLNIAKIKFIDGPYTTKSTYEYANFDPDLKVDDVCVVKSAHHGLGVAMVVEIVERNDIAVQREIVAKVDTSDYEKRVANRTKAAELKVKMQERVKQLQDIALYKIMAENDSTMTELLKEYQEVTGM